MNKKILLVFLISFLFSACSEWVSVNPLSPPTEPDKKLEGVWKYDSKEGEKVYLHIGKKTGKTMAALSVEHRKDGSLDIVEIPFFITKTENNNYLNIRYKDIDKDAGEKGNEFIFIKYSFTDNNTLFFYQFDPEVIKSAVQSGKLKGEVYYQKMAKPPESDGKKKTTPEKTIDSVKITDTSENMVKFFKTEGDKFIPDEVLKFIRVK